MLGGIGRRGLSRGADGSAAAAAAAAVAAGSFESTKCSS